MRWLCREWLWSQTCLSNRNQHQPAQSTTQTTMNHHVLGHVLIFSPPSPGEAVRRMNHQGSWRCSSPPCVSPPSSRARCPPTAARRTAGTRTETETGRLGGSGSELGYPMVSIFPEPVGATVSQPHTCRKDKENIGKWNENGLICDQHSSFGGRVDRVMRSPVISVAMSKWCRPFDSGLSKKTYH